MKKVRSKIKYIIILVIGIIVGSTVGIVATNVINANQVGYSNSKTTKTNIQDAIDELYLKAEQCSGNSSENKGHASVKIAYFNPVTGNSCTNYTETNSTAETKTGCMKWYVYDEDSTTYTMILDHNTTARVYYNYDGVSTSMGTRRASQIGQYYNEIGYDLAQLTSTSGWKVTPRLITGQEIADITGNTSWTPSGNYFYLDTNTTNFDNHLGSTLKSSYAWLFDGTSAGYSHCIYYGCNIGGNSCGYWTSTAVSSDSQKVWAIDGNGSLYNGQVTSTYLGLRPVITVQKSKFAFVNPDEPM